MIWKIGFFWGNLTCLWVKMLTMNVSRPGSCQAQGPLLPSSLSPLVISLIKTGKAE